MGNTPSTGNTTQQRRPPIPAPNFNVGAQAPLPPPEVNSSANFRRRSQPVSNDSFTSAASVNSTRRLDQAPLSKSAQIVQAISRLDTSITMDEAYVLAIASLIRIETGYQANLSQYRNALEEFKSAHSAPPESHKRLVQEEEKRKGIETSMCEKEGIIQHYMASSSEHQEAKISRDRYQSELDRLEPIVQKLVEESEEDWETLFKKEKKFSPPAGLLEETRKRLAIFHSYEDVANQLIAEAKKVDVFVVEVVTFYVGKLRDPLKSNVNIITHFVARLTPPTIDD